MIEYESSFKSEYEQVLYIRKNKANIDTNILMNYGIKHLNEIIDISLSDNGGYEIPVELFIESYKKWEYYYNEINEYYNQIKDIIKGNHKNDYEKALVILKNNMEITKKFLYDNMEIVL